MSTVLRPVGPQPDRVYWVRRAVVLAALVVVLLVAWFAFSALRGGGDADAGQDGPGEGTVEEGATVPDDDAAAAPEEGATGPTVCAGTDLTLTLTADARSYAAGVQPVFAFAVTNTGAASCTVDMGEAQREVLITSGTDRIWSSRDCLAEAPEQLLLLEPGARSDAFVPWGRGRSAEGCTQGLPEPRPGTYSAVVTMLGATSEPVVFDLGE
ncbi:hypothetical protein [Actinotalea subterranea]|uniref:hypothetical protein n=1 Tax=Actinotalea subterranea TaxID=2607497 RepID=UPI0011EDAB0F|nr:hypothetical protein [Actinotalea subterranea]